MRIISRASTDIQDIIHREGTDVLLTNPDGTKYAIKGLVFRIDSYIDPGTQVQVKGQRTSVTVSLLDLEGDEPSEDWQIITSDTIGGDVSGMVISPEFDRTLATVRFVIELAEVAEPEGT